MHTVLYKVGKPSPSVVTKELEGPMTQLTHVRLAHPRHYTSPSPLTETRVVQMLLDDKQYSFPIALAATAQRTADDSAGACTLVCLALCACAMVRVRWCMCDLFNPAVNGV